MAPGPTKCVGKLVHFFSQFNVEGEIGCLAGNTKWKPALARQGRSDA
jgi:hypothetical protein